MKIKLVYLALPAIFCMSLADATPKPTPQEQIANPQTLEVRGFDEVQIADRGKLSGYKSFFVMQPTLEFDRYWLREYQRKMSDRDEQRIRESYTKALQTALENVLGDEPGLRKAEQAGPDTLIVVPSLTRFRITAPDLSFRPMTEDFVDYAGSARLTLVLQDGGNRQTLAQLSDFSRTSTFGMPGDLQRANRVENLHDFKMLYKRWAGRLVDFLVPGVS